MVRGTKRFIKGTFWVGKPWVGEDSRSEMVPNLSPLPMGKWGSGEVGKWEVGSGYLIL